MSLEAEILMDPVMEEGGPSSQPPSPPPVQSEAEYMRGRMAYLEQVSNTLHAKVQALSTLPPPPPQAPIYYPPPGFQNLNLPPPPHFSGDPSELHVFHLKLSQFLIGNRHTYTTDAAQVMYAGSLLIGSAAKWYAALVDFNTMLVPPHYTLDIFFAELAGFFGGGVTLDSRERSLDNLRQVGTVADFAINFQNITNTFHPRWPDHPLIYIFSRKLKEAIRFQLTSQGSIPTVFRDYIAAAIAVEHNQAAASHSRHQQPPPHPKPLPPPRPLPPPPYQAPPLLGQDPMDLDGSRGRRNPLTNEERRRRADSNLCAYCGAPGHAIATCPKAAHIRRVQGTYQPPGYPYPGYGFPPLGAPPGPFPGPWTTVVTDPHAAAYAAAAAQAAAAVAAAAVSKNDPPSQ